MLSNNFYVNFILGVRLVNTPDEIGKGPTNEVEYDGNLIYWDEKNFVYYHECLAIFYEIIAEISLTDSTYINSKATQKLMPAMQYIHSHYRDRNFDFQILPSLCSLGYTRFLKLFRTQNGCTPSDYMNILRVNAAKEMITLGKYSPASISDILGYDNLVGFKHIQKR